MAAMGRSCRFRLIDQGSLMARDRRGSGGVSYRFTRTRNGRMCLTNGCATLGYKGDSGEEDFEAGQQ